MLLQSAVSYSVVFTHISEWPWITGGADLRLKGQRSRSLKRKCRKESRILCEFLIINCYSGGPRVTAVTGPGFFLFQTRHHAFFIVDAYTMEDLVFHWRTDATAVELNKDISLPEYDLKGVSQIVCSKKINSTGLTSPKAVSIKKRLTL